MCASKPDSSVGLNSARVPVNSLRDTSGSNCVTRGETTKQRYCVTILAITYL